jgi:hypothetical protein
MAQLTVAAAPPYSTRMNGNVRLQKMANHGFDSERKDLDNSVGCGVWHGFGQRRGKIMDDHLGMTLPLLSKEGRNPNAQLLDCRWSRQCGSR